MRYTIHDIARELGVSARTIGRVVNDQSGVGAATRERVEAFIQKVGYQPHSAARSLRSQKFDSVGVAMACPPEDSPLSQELLSWLFAELYDVFGLNGDFIGFDFNPPTKLGVRDYARGIWQMRYGACLFVGPFLHNDPIIKRVHEQNSPYLALTRFDSVENGCFGAVDYVQAAYLSTRYLLERGHKRIGMLQGFNGYIAGSERKEGYLKAYKEFGIEADPSLIFPVLFSAESLCNNTRKMLSDPSVTAFVECSGAENALSVREGARQAGRILGGEVEFVVWTYTCNASVMAEAKAHVWVPLRESITEAIALLGDWYYGRRSEPFQVIYPPVLYETPSDTEIPPSKPVFTISNS